MTYSRAQREELGWSQRQLAERAGMTQPGVAKFEAGAPPPRCPCWNASPQRSASPPMSASNPPGAG